MCQPHTEWRKACCEDTARRFGTHALRYISSSRGWTGMDSTHAPSHSVLGGMALVRWPLHHTIATPDYNA
eukprot:3247333-Prymnesium_polylepis.1